MGSFIQVTLSANPYANIDAWNNKISGIDNLFYT